MLRTGKKVRCARRVAIPLVLDKVLFSPFDGVTMKAEAGLVYRFTLSGCVCVCGSLATSSRLIYLSILYLNFYNENGYVRTRRNWRELLSHSLCLFLFELEK